MRRRTIIYRGSIKSCNYHCSYCPFSKHPASVREQERDREQWFLFVRRIAEQGERQKIGAILVAPYGEALIHPWYWEGLAALSAFPWMDAVGAQTNLSFPAEEALERFAAAGGVGEKLRLWATFHPEMTDAAGFAARCGTLVKRGIAVCAGAVGVPGGSGTAGVLRELRRLLPEECYFWINRMDGMAGAYTEEETRLFSELDPYFYRELLCHPADLSECAGRLMAEGDGRLRTCNISPVQAVRWRTAHAGKGEPLSLPPVCTRRRCSCYLAYGGRDNLVSQLLFGPYPVFRIPRRPRAVFLDIVGTLLPGLPGLGGEPGGAGEPGCGSAGVRSAGAGEPGCGSAGRCGEPDEELVAGLNVLRAQGVPLFFATTLPYGEAARRCRSIWHMFSGGVFSGGAQICMNAEGGGQQGDTAGRSCFYYLREELLPALKQQKGNDFRILTYRDGGRLYKITLCRPARRPWSDAEAARICGGLLREYQARYLIEDHCLQIISDQADKAAGVRMICGWLGISPKEAFAAGDSAEDCGMCDLCGGV